MQNANNSYIGRFITDIGGLVKEVIPVAVGLALLYFLWGVATTVVRSGDEKSVEAGKNRMKWGIIALFVMLGVWGIVSLLGTVLGLPPLPAQQGVDNPISNPLQAQG